MTKLTIVPLVIRPFLLAELRSLVKHTNNLRSGNRAAAQRPGSS